MVELAGVMSGLVLVKEYFLTLFQLVNNLTSNRGALWRRHKTKTQHKFSSALMLVKLGGVWLEVWSSGIYIQLLGLFWNFQSCFFYQLLLSSQRKNGG